MAKSWDIFAQKVAKKITYPLSGDVSAIVSVSNFLVQFGWQPVGKYDFLSVSLL